MEHICYLITCVLTLIGTVTDWPKPVRIAVIVGSAFELGLIANRLMELYQESKEETGVEETAE